MDLNPTAVFVFVKVAQAGSFTGAGRQLSMPTSTVSAHIARLEKRLGVTLLHRTTRKLHLTEAGETYFAQALQGVEAILNADVQASAAQQEPQGTLRITSSIDTVDTVATLVSDFRQRYPKVALELRFTQDFVDLIAENIDVAIRAGKLKDSRLVARKVGIGTWVPVTSPAYLRRMPLPAHPRDLRDHALIQFDPMGRDHWNLRNGRAAFNVPLPKQIIANHATAVKSLAIAGHGIALLPTFLCRSELEDGQLVRILPDWLGRSDPVHLVYAAQRFVAPKVRAFVDFAAEALSRVYAP